MYSESPIPCCQRFPGENPGKSVKDIPDLAKTLDEISTDYLKWVTTFRCKQCGQLWEERYRSAGHGNVPEVLRGKSA